MRLRLGCIVATTAPYCAYIGIGLYRARIAQPVASFTVFEMGPDGPLLRRLVDVSHLPPELRVGTGV